MLESRRCLLPVRLTHGPTLLGILTATLVTLLIPSQPLNAQESQYSGQGSYAIYPGWTGPKMQEGLLQLTFRTEIGDGLLLYAEGSVSSGTEALAVMLEGGKILVRVQRQELRTVGTITLPSDAIEPEEFCVSENLNDNMPHTLSLQQTPNNFTVSVLDRSASEVSRLLSRSSDIGSMKIYIGGLPMNQRDDHIQFSISGNFSGCLGDIQSSNDSTNASTLVSVSPLEQQGVVDGCSVIIIDPCADISCGGGGSCVAVPPDSYFCDCSSTPFAGANCTEDFSMHRLSLTLNNYLCYALDNFPLINSTGSVRLLSPLPQTGSIMTGVSSGGNQFNLYLEDDILKLELISGDRSVKLSTSQVLDSSTSYQVNFEIRSNRADLILETISESGGLTEIERLNGTVTFSVPTSFTTVCVGGSMLEIPYYMGVLERVIYNAAPLSDQSFKQQYATVETPVNLISVSEVSETPLTFQRLNLADNYQRITFEIRLEMASNMLTGIPLATRGGELQFVVATGAFSIISSSLLFFVRCSKTPTVDDKWHRIDITLSRNGDGTGDLNTTVDEISCDPLTDENRVKLGQILDSLINSSAPFFDFGVTQTGHMSTSNGRFVGCLQNIEFRETADSEPVRPDLASAIRAEERFSRGEEQCYSCRMDKFMDCQNAGEVCADCGYLYLAQCLDSLQSCPAESPSNVTSPSMEPTPPITTPGITDDSTAPTNPPPTPGTPLARTQLGLYIGIAIGGAAAIIIAVIIVVFLLCFCVRVRGGGQGFYRTEESNGKAVTMLHYSASLRQIASEQVTMAETNGISPMHADGLRAKEFYM